HGSPPCAPVPLAPWPRAARRVRIRPTASSRRNFLRGGAVLATAAATYAASEVVVRAIPTLGAARRFTGSYEAGSYRPDLMPVSSWLLDAIPNLEQSAWRLRAGGRERTYEELIKFNDRVARPL